MTSRFKTRIGALADRVLTSREYALAVGHSVIIDGISTPEEIARAHALCTRVPLIRIRFVAPPDQYEVEMHESQGSCRWQSPTPEQPGDETDAALQEVVKSTYKRASFVTGALPEVGAENDDPAESRD